ncbi:MAG: signal peptidase II, partial [Ktedonobacteraceae bacterium]
FQIPQINFSFAIFNIADAAITVGVILLFVTLLFGGVRGKAEVQGQPNEVKAPTQDEIVSTRAQEQDAQS